MLSINMFVEKSFHFNICSFPNDSFNDDKEYKKYDRKRDEIEQKITPNKIDIVISTSQYISRTLL